MKILQNILFIVVLGWSITVFAIVQEYSVSPGHLKFDLKVPSTKLLWIKNDGTQAVTLKIKPWRYDLKTLHLGSYINKKTAYASDLTPYLLVSPRILTLQPMQSRKVRVSIRIPATIVPGSYYSHLILYPVEKLYVQDNPSNSGMSLRVRMAMAVAVHANYGSGEPKLNIKCRITKAHKMELQIKNNSIWMFDGKLEIYNNVNANADSLFKTIPFVVPRDSQRTMKFNWQLPAGKAAFMLKWQGNEPNIGSGSTICRQA